MARILIIDDEAGVCEEFSEVLREEHHEVETARDGQEGLGKLQEKNYDLVFLDVLMPRMEGREVLEQIRRISKTPVVIMSGFVPPHKEKEILQAGAMACLKKPLDLSQVHGLIDRALEQKKD